MKCRGLAKKISFCFKFPGAVKGLRHFCFNIFEMLARSLPSLPPNATAPAELKFGHAPMHQCSSHAQSAFPTIGTSRRRPIDPAQRCTLTDRTAVFGLDCAGGLDWTDRIHRHAAWISSAVDFLVGRAKQLRQVGPGSIPSRQLAELLFLCGHCTSKLLKEV